ncbi:LPS export ABC transporter periplasmic protein LptC [Bartonella sp. HY329]|uniref:LPS export ABC transporter periplasmic protein LptC n=1 Tax=unclassified Bartonella TaxID=2645622 RepID=UPI0021C7B0DD|nr:MULTISPECIES: LPS export ABC transporter periplasmic protein LptC [unclassified Bartonella]UXM94812.1 LPS export ABC transporter periplasmic protein LptC [Bartonella sp. HY329]UXN09135.1 LPS export ABC transporter periplasmic protein LptC [Bartonella sp. HY328]
MNDRQNNSNSIFAVDAKKDSVFLAAMKHSGRVKFIKILLPIIAVVIAGIFAWFTFFSAPSTADIVALNTEGNDKLVMTSPKIEGYSKSQKPYSFNASRAVQDPLRPGLIELEDITAKMPLGERAMADVNAISGIYDNINGRMVLEKPFSVTTSDGVKASFQSADINIETSRLTTKEPVEIIRDREHLTADSLSIKENGQVFVFKGKVQLIIAPQDAGNKAQ